MKKATLSLTTLAALTVATVALGDEPNRAEGPTSTLPSSTAPSASPQQGTQPGSGGASQVGSGAAQPGAVVGQPHAAQSAIPPSSPPCPSGVSTTTITAAEIAPAPILPPAPPRDTVTVKQSIRPNRPLLYTGSAMLIGTYAATAAMTAVRDIRDGNGDQSLYIPVAGPWLHLNNTATSTLDKALIAGSGVAQGTGVVLGVLSLLVPERIPAATIQAGSVKVLITATSPGKGAAGIGAVGRF